MFEKGSLKYCANCNAYRKILTPNLDDKIASITSTKDNKVNEKEILDELRKEDPNVPHMSFSTVSYAFTRREIIDENGVHYTIKRLTNHPTTANTDTNKQLRVEVVSQLITYIQMGYI